MRFDMLSRMTNHFNMDVLSLFIVFYCCTSDLYSIKVCEVLCPVLLPYQKGSSEN